MSLRIHLLLVAAAAAVMSLVVTVVFAEEHEPVDCNDEDLPCIYYILKPNKSCILTSAICPEPPRCAGPEFESCNPLYWCSGVWQWEECAGETPGAVCKSTPGCTANGGCGNKMLGQCLDDPNGPGLRCANGIVQVEHCTRKACCEE